MGGPRRIVNLMMLKHYSLWKLRTQAWYIIHNAWNCYLEGLVKTDLCWKDSCNTFDKSGKRKHGSMLKKHMEYVSWRIWNVEKACYESICHNNSVNC